MLLAKNIANHYTLKGSASAISYGEDFGGNPQIVFNNKAYSGVMVQNTSAGTMASVVLETAPDAYTKLLSVLVPPVQLPPNSSEQNVETIAIFSTHRTSFAGPQLLVGQTIEYAVEALKGTATYLLS